MWGGDKMAGVIGSESRISNKNSLPSSSFAITTPLPALAENRKPALKMVKMANPFAFSSTVRGMTYVIRTHTIS